MDFRLLEGQQALKNYANSVDFRGGRIPESALSDRKMGSKLNFFAMLAAVGAFYLPWLEVSCTVKGESKVMFTQTGIQVIKGDATLGEEAKSLKELITKDKQSNEAAPMVGIVATMVGLGFLVSMVGAKAGGRTLSVGILAACALALMGAQMAMEFPATRPSGATEDSEIVQEQSEKMRKEFIKERYLPGIYLELGELAVPVLVLLAGGWRRPS